MFRQLLIAQPQLSLHLIPYSVLYLRFFLLSFSRNPRILSPRAYRRMMTILAHSQICSYRRCVRASTSMCVCVRMSLHASVSTYMCQPANLCASLSVYYLFVCSRVCLSAPMFLCVCELLIRVSVCLSAPMFLCVCELLIRVCSERTCGWTLSVRTSYSHFTQHTPCSTSHTRHFAAILHV